MIRAAQSFQLSAVVWPNPIQIQRSPRWPDIIRMDPSSLPVAGFYGNRYGSQNGVSRGRRRHFGFPCPLGRVINVYLCIYPTVVNCGFPPAPGSGQDANIGSYDWTLRAPSALVLLCSLLLTRHRGQGTRNIYCCGWIIVQSDS